MIDRGTSSAAGRAGALIPARGGSKSIPRKNLVEVGGALLAVHAIRAALHPQVREVWVSTEDEEIVRVAEEGGARVLLRPAGLASDEATTEDVLLHFATAVSFNLWVLLQCTCPFTTSRDIDTYEDREFVRRLLEKS